MALEISVRTNLADVERGLSDLAKRQMPYATALALTSLSKLVAADAVSNLSAKLKNPSPFTLRSVKTMAARKDNLVAKVYVMDKAAEYLEPYERGGVHKLAGKALLNPKDIALNQYGQLRKGTLAALKGRSDIFIGPVKTKKGIVNGVWQRTAVKATITNRKTGKARVSSRGVNTSGALKLLIRFGDALAVRTHLGYHARATATVNANFNAEMDKAMIKAMGTAHP
ncbi:hypothetical protein GQ37_008140 [Janthinobacterium sp. BJB1]|nr:hypothetical protein GQ37_008140 [Janthinobacterium sp. BJB1]